jgi:hypothetical protein
MKTTLLAAGLVAFGASAIPADVNAEPLSASVCASGACTPVDPVTAAIAVGVGIAGTLEQSCRDDKESSCTEEAKEAGQNLIDYARGKKNGFKAIERAFRKLF